jgi:hypothetical protein
MMKERTVGSHGNYGVMLHAEAKKSMKAKQVETEAAKLKREAAEVAGATFHPVINRGYGPGGVSRCGSRIGRAPSQQCMLCSHDFFNTSKFVIACGAKCNTMVQLLLPCWWQAWLATQVTNVMAHY